FSALFLEKHLEYSREVSLLFAFFSLIFILLERLIVRKTLRHLRHSGYNQKHMLIIGAGPVGLDFARRVQNHQEFGYSVVGFLDDDGKMLGATVLGKPVLGGCPALPVLLGNMVFDEVVVALPLNAYDKYGKIVDECERAGVRVRIIPDYNRFLPGRPKIEEFDGIPLLNIRKIPLDDPFNKFIKRFFDIAVSAVAVLLTSPVMTAIAVGI